ncbi:hypothetical protein ABIA43_007258 [Bradyrhizobium sp. USDA 328]
MDINASLCASGPRNDAKRIYGGGTRPYKECERAHRFSLGSMSS